MSLELIGVIAAVVGAVVAVVNCAAARRLWHLWADTVVRLRMALSPKYRFRRLAGRAEALGAKLSDGKNSSSVGDYLLTDRTHPRIPTPQMEAEIEAFKDDLDRLGVYRTPPIEDVDGWKRVAPELRRLMRSGALPDARSHDWTS